MSPAAMSRHLRVLRTTGLVEEQHQGDDARVRVYRLKPQRFRALRRDDEERGHMSQELDMFDRLRSTRGAAAFEARRAREAVFLETNPRSAGGNPRAARAARSLALVLAHVFRAARVVPSGVSDSNARASRSASGVVSPKAPRS